MTHTIGDTLVNALVPDAVGYYRPQRPKIKYEIDHLMISRTLPHWVVEVEVAAEVDSKHKGFRKIVDDYFPLVGNGGRVEEGWVLHVPDEFHVETVKELPADKQTVNEVQSTRPSRTEVFVAVLTRKVPLGHVGHIRGYYRLLPNTVFRVPKCSLLSSNGPAGGEGAPDLNVNELLREIGMIHLVKLPSASCKDRCKF